MHMVKQDVAAAGQKQTYVWSLIQATEKKYM